MIPSVIVELRSLGLPPAQVRSLLIYEFHVRWPVKVERLKMLLSAIHGAGLVDSDELP